MLKSECSKRSLNFSVNVSKLTETSLYNNHELWFILLCFFSCITQADICMIWGITNDILFRLYRICRCLFSWSSSSFPGINAFAHVPDKEWFETQAVVRVTLGNFLFFSLFSILMIGVKDQNDTRDSWHHGGWSLKFIGWCVLVALMFFLPNGAIYAYGMRSNSTKSF